MYTCAFNHACVLHAQIEDEGLNAEEPVLEEDIPPEPEPEPEIGKHQLHNPLREFSGSIMYTVEHVQCQCIYMYIYVQCQVDNSCFFQCPLRRR